MTAPVRITAAHARRFHRRAVLLDSPAASVGEALAHHGFVQIDPINVCGRMHDLILRNRVAGYREGDLFAHLHGGASPLPAEARTALEQHLPRHGILTALPVDAWPYLQAAMSRRSDHDSRWSGRLSADEAAVADDVLREITRRGPLSSEDFDDDRPAEAVWGAATLVKATMQKLFFHGRLLIARRGRGQRRLYDLPERVLPARVRRANAPADAESARWAVRLFLRQRRLMSLSRKELAHIDDEVQRLDVEGHALFCLRDDLPLLDRVAHDEPARAPQLLAPLDPLVYDRQITERLWGFPYTWEVYTPPAKRVRGYYALPVLAGDALVGHVDPKMDRAAGRLKVLNRAVKRGHAVRDAVRTLERFLTASSTSSADEG
ncbi:MAG: crosslink repair DNA glycosylase YcaQ family protein [Polyangiales bacterium]